MPDDKDATKEPVSKEPPDYAKEMRAAAESLANKDSIEKIDFLRADAETVRRWQEMRLGMFVHWGPISLRGTEIGWSRGGEVPREVYDELYKEFNPIGFDADEWVELAKSAGMKYIVLTAKHHDGFCLWDSAWTDYDMMATPFSRDIVGELSAACKRHEMRLGLYYSISDYHHTHYLPQSHGGPAAQPEGPADFEIYVQYMKDQLKELHTKYGPLLCFWFDGEWESSWTHPRAVDLNDFVHRLQDDILVNNRVDKGRAGLQGMSDRAMYAGDFGTPEQTVGNFNRTDPWETNITIATQWAWKPDDQVKSLAECLRILLHTVGGDGNLLLNVGPMPDGRIEPSQARRLKELGDFVDRYSDGIYATRGGPFMPGDWGASTCRGTDVYLFITEWPTGRDLRLPKVLGRIRSAENLSGGSVRIHQDDSALTVDVPPNDRDALVTVVKLQLDAVAEDIEPVKVP